MSSDEAKLIQFLSKADVIPYIQINALQKGKKGIVDVCKLTSLGKDVNFAFPNNIELYLDNFVTLGLLSCFERKALVEHSMYDAVIDIYNDIKVVLLASIKTDFGAQAYDTVDNLPVTGNRKYIEYLMLGRLFPNAPGQGVAELSYDEGFYRLTNYGKLFIRACTQS
jgi:hypothetical protein